MKKRIKWIAALLSAVLVFCAAERPAAAEAATLGVWVTGVRTLEDGSTVTETLEGSFRVLQNGEEIGTVKAGKTTVTLTDTERIRIVPLAQTFSPEWDLSTAYLEVHPESGQNTVVPVKVYPLRDSAASPKPQAAASEDGEDEDGEDAGEPDETDDWGTGMESTIVSYASVQAEPTPTLPYYDLSAVASPQPDLSTLYVSGTCWFDESGNGLFDEGEPTLPGVRIEMDGIKNGLHYETVSGENGLWSITNISPAAYDLTVTAPDGMMFTRIASTNGRKSIIARDGVRIASKRIDLNDKESKRNQYIGFVWAGEVSGRCFLDANYNGMYDDGEEPMPGVKVTAIKQAKDEEAAVAYSDENGFYTLTGLRQNTYKMRAVLPDDGSEFTVAVSDPLGNHFKGRPGRRENFWSDFVLNAAQKREMNVGVIYPASITGTVYMDNDFSADQSVNEKIVSGFLVTLKDENGETITSDKTSVRGKYELTGVPPGNYTLSVTALKGYAFTKPGEGNVILNRTGGEGYSEPFFVAIAENREGMDIGMIQPGTVEGTVFADRNDDGKQDEGEAGLAGVTVRLINEESGEADFSAVVDQSGKYLFDAVMPGQYHLEFELPEGAVFARTAGGGNTITGDGLTGSGESFSFASGDWVHGPACGALTLGHITGMAYHDRNGDGQRGPGEEPLAETAISLVPSRPEVEAVSAVTDLDGKFTLEEIRPDDYVLYVTCPDDLVLSRTDAVDLPLTAGKAAQQANLNISMGESWENQELGAVIPASLSGQVWLDENNNGIFDEGENTPEGYEVTVTDDLTGKVFDTLQTDAEGKYETSGMIPGSFTVSFPLSKDTIACKPGDSVFTTKGSSLVVEGIALSEGEMRDGLLLGMVRYTEVSGYVWIDRGDSVEPLSGAEIRLTDGEGNILRSLLSGEDGTYVFDELMPGEYTIEASMPEGCVIIEPGDRRLSGSRVSVITQAVNREGSSEPFEVKMAQNVTKMDIGCVLPGRMGDLCWLDADGDGLQGMDEPGIPGVKIELMRDGTYVAETVSDQYGFYRFEDIYPGVYTLRVTPPAEVKPTVRRTDIPMIASVLEDEGEDEFLSAEIEVESDKANYNADLGFVSLRTGVVPAGTGEGATQDWTGYSTADE